MDDGEQNAGTVSLYFTMTDQVNDFSGVSDYDGTNALFTDVETGAWYDSAVRYVYETGLMSGTSESTFSPDTAATRGMIAAILYRLEGSPAVSGDTAFADVDAGRYDADAVAWAAANGILSGYDNGLFGPDDAVTREQLAAILYRYAAWQGRDVTAAADLSGYTDAQAISDYAAQAMAWANAEGLICGTGANTLSPAGTATRAQIASVLQRFCTAAAE